MSNTAASWVHLLVNRKQSGEVYFEAENPKGILGFYVVSKGGGVPWRMKIRSPSFCNLSILPKLCVGNMVSDVVSILGSLDFVMGGMAAALTDPDIRELAKYYSSQRPSLCSTYEIRDNGTCKGL